jgi:glycerate dehydrogenase
VLVTNKGVIGEAELAQLPDVKLIAVTAAGTNVVDHEAAGKRGIPVCNTPAYGTDAVAQHVFALILELCRRTSLHHASVLDGEWNRRGDFCYWLTPQMELTGKTLGVFGFGNLGRRVAELAHAFRMNVVACAHRETEKPDWEPFEFVSREELFRRSDVISLHCPLTKETRGLVCAETLAMMKPGALLINTARGPVVNSRDAAEALHSGRLGGFGTDVLEQEPPAADEALFSAPNVIITPHIAWATDGARGNIVNITLENIRAFLRGAPQNVVNRSFLSA